MLVFSCSLSYIYYLPLDINELGDIFHLWFLFLPFVLYQDLLVILILFSSFLDMLIMLTLVLIKYELHQLDMFESIYFESLQIYLLIITNHSECANHENDLERLMQNPSKIVLHVWNQHLLCLLCLSFCKNSLLYGNDVFQFLRINSFH